jgi:hypothetical protein
MQENRSFDEYFGRFPGANGIPAGVCVPDPVDGGCLGPYHDPRDKNTGGNHKQEDAEADIDGGKMDGSSPARPRSAATSIIPFPRTAQALLLT